MTRLEMIQNSSRKRLANLRRLDYFVQSPKFTSVYDGCTEEERIKFDKIILKGGFDELMNFVDAIILREIENYSVKDLRNRAARLGIRNYWSMSKSELLLRILNVSTTPSDVGRNVPASDKEESQTPAPAA